MLTILFNNKSCNKLFKNNLCDKILCDNITKKCNEMCMQNTNELPFVLRLSKYSRETFKAV